jgi:antitoxin YefM
MQVVNYTEARNNFKSMLDQVCDDFEPMIITRKNGSAAVLISIEEYNSFKETAYLLSTPANATRLTESLKQSGRGEIETHELSL